MALSRRHMGIDEVLDSVQLMNRIMDGPWSITFDGRAVTWQGGEVKTLPRKLAEWFQHKSMYKFNPGDQQYGEPATYHYVLAIVGQGDNSPLTAAEVRARKELFDRENMARKIDQATGQELRDVYVDTRGVAGASTAGIDRLERQATREVSSAIIRTAAEEIAEAAANASEREIDDAVSGLTGVPAGA